MRTGPVALAHLGLGYDRPGRPVVDGALTEGVQF